MCKTLRASSLDIDYICVPDRWNKSSSTLDLACVLASKEQNIFILNPHLPFFISLVRSEVMTIYHTLYYIILPLAWEQM